MSCWSSSSTGRVNTRREKFFEEQTVSISKRAESGQYILWENVLTASICQCKKNCEKKHVFHSECVQCQRRKQTKIMDAKQSLHFRMYSGESPGSRYLLAALAAKTKCIIVVLVINRCRILLTCTVTACNIIINSELAITYNYYCRIQSRNEILSDHASRIT